MRNTKITETILFSILFLFFLQSLSDFIEAIYAFGLLVTAFTIEIASIILLFTPLLLLVFRKAPSRSFLLGLALLQSLARLLEPMLSPGGKLVACGISVGAFMMLFPLLLQRRLNIRGWQTASGLAIALSLSIFLRTAQLQFGFIRVRDIPGHQLAAGNPGRQLCSGAWTCQRQTISPQTGPLQAGGLPGSPSGWLPSS